MRKPRSEEVVAKSKLVGACIVRYRISKVKNQKSIDEKVMQSSSYGNWYSRMGPPRRREPPKRSAKRSLGRRGRNSNRCSSFPGRSSPARERSHFPRTDPSRNTPDRPRSPSPRCSRPRRARDRRNGSSRRTRGSYPDGQRSSRRFQRGSLNSRGRYLARCLSACSTRGYPADNGERNER